MKIKILIIVLFFSIFSFARCPISALIEGPVSYYGELKVKEGTSYINGAKTNDYAQVRGVSFFWSQWSGQFYNSNAVERLVKDWKVEIIRAAYGQTGSEFSNDTALTNRGYIKTVVDAAIQNDIYVIIDWHSHSAHNVAETQNSIAFFEEMAQIYGECDNVVFEIYNEPINTSWLDIKNYAEQIIPIIRKYSDNLILVGTQTYSQKIKEPIYNSIDDGNVGYVFHFYAATHPLKNFRDSINSALISNKVPIFVTEYGTTASDGGCSPEVSKCDRDNYNSHSSDNTDEWYKFLDGRKISSTAWSVFDKYEGSAFFGTVPRGTFDQTLVENWSDTTKMTASGRYIFKKLNDYYLKAPWNPAVPIKFVNGHNNSIGLKVLANSTLMLNLHKSGNITLEIYSLSGENIGILLSGYQSAGVKEVSFKNLNLQKGVYIMRLKQGLQTKMLKFFI